MTSQNIISATSLPYAHHLYESFDSVPVWSKDFLLGFVLEGSMEVRYHNRIRRFQRHDFSFFLPFETINVISYSSDVRLLTLSIRDDFLYSLIPQFTSLSLRQHHLGNDINNDIYNTLCHHLATIVFHDARTETCSHLRKISAITGILITLLDAYAVKSDASPTQSYTAERVHDILLYVKQNYTRKLTLTDMASHLGLHPQYFSTFFTKQFQMGFSEYLAEYRVNASINQLLHSDESILDIALQCGFSNHKTYASAFRKLHQMSPTEYRKAHRDTEETVAAQPARDPFDTHGIFSFLRPFLSGNLFFDTSVTSEKQSITLDVAALSTSAKSHRPLYFYTIGRALACLRTDIQQQMRRAREDLRVDYFRIRDIFSDALYVYYETDEKEALYNWQTLDQAMDFILSLGAKPFPELGYMPEKLASKRQYAGLQFHPNISPPKSMEKWQSLVRNFLLHYATRYGMEELEDWYFDFWTSPDLTLKMAYWNESMEEFFRFYKATYDVFMEVNPALRLGTPNFSTIEGFPWYDAFFDYCTTHQMRPAFVSFHAYGCDIVTNEALAMDLNAVDSRMFSVSNQNQVMEFLEKMHVLMDEKGFGNAPVIVSDFSLNFMPTDLIRDTCYMAAYLSHTTFRTLKLVQALGHWCLSDVSEDAYPRHTPFWGGPGLLSYYGVPKASYNTLSLLSRMGDVILKQGDNYVLAKRKSTLQLYIYNLIPFDSFFPTLDQSLMDETHRYNIYANADDMQMSIAMQLPKGSYYIKRYEVSREHGSSYDIWVQMGFPETFSKEMEDYLRENAAPHISYTVQDVERTLFLDERIPAHGLVLLEIKERV